VVVAENNSSIKVYRVVL